MALPTYWVSLNRKDLAEKAIVAKRDKEASRIQKCNEIASYHEELARKSSKYRSLEDPQSLKIARANEESRVKEKLKAEKRDRLERRRAKLAQFLAVENDQYMKELNELEKNERGKDPWNITKLKEQIADLQRKRKEGEQNMQRRYMHHLYASSNGYYAKEEDEEALKYEASEAWKQRKEELNKLRLEKKQKDQERMKTFELERMKAEKEESEVEFLQLEEQEKFDIFIREKSEELNETQNEIKKLKIEKQILMSHMENLVSVQQKRDLVREIQKKGTLKIYALSQPKEKLRRMSNEVQHALDLDLKMLISICTMNNLAAEDTALALLNLECAEDVKNKIERQIAMEKQRELEIQLLYYEEASKMWEKRKEEWTLEGIARDELINDLFQTFSKHISEKLETNIAQQKKFVQIKEICIKEIAEAKENSNARNKNFDEKRAYFRDKAKRLGEELEAYKSSAS